MFQMGLGLAREFPGSQVDQALAAEIDRATPERAALLGHIDFKHSGGTAAEPLAQRP